MSQLDDIRRRVKKLADKDVFSIYDIEPTIDELLNLTNYLIEQENNKL